MALYIIQEVLQPKTLLPTELQENIYGMEYMVKCIRNSIIFMKNNMKRDYCTKKTALYSFVVPPPAKYRYNKGMDIYILEDV